MPNDAAARALVQRIHAADHAKDLDGFMALLAPEIRFRLGSQPELIGKPAVREAIAGLFGMVGGITHALREIWRKDEAIAYEAAVTFDLPGGRSVTLPYANVLRLAPDGLIGEYRIHIDLAALLGAPR